MTSPEPKSSDNTSKIIVAIISVGAAIILTILWTQGKLDFIPRHWEADYLKAVRETAIDPDSVQFRRVEGPLNRIVCGEWRARNRMGAYVEWQPFMVRDIGSGRTNWFVSTNVSFHQCRMRQLGID